MTPDTGNATTRNSGNPRPEKVAVVEEVRERLDATSATILAEYRGLSVAQLAELRSALRHAGGDFKVYKNTLVRFAARELGLEIEDLLTGPTALAFVTDKPDGTPGDAVDVAKVLKDFGKDNPALVLKGGVLGENLLSADDTSALADVEPRDVLLAKLAGGMAAPMQKFAGLLQALPRNFAYGLKALIDQAGGAPASDEATSADEPAAEDTPAEESADEPTESEAPAEASEPSASEASDDDGDDGSVQRAAEDSGADETEEHTDLQTQDDSATADSAADEAASETE